VLEEQEGCGAADAIAANMVEAGIKVRLLEEGLASDRNVIVLGGDVQNPSETHPAHCPGEGKRAAGTRPRRNAISELSSSEPLLVTTASSRPSLTRSQQAIRAMPISQAGQRV